MMKYLTTTTARKPQHTAKILKTNIPGGLPGGDCFPFVLKRPPLKVEPRLGRSLPRFFKLPR